jgi:hypothetical protein
VTTELKTPVRYHEHVDCPTIGLEAGAVRIEIWEEDGVWERNKIKKDSQSLSTFDTLEEAIYDTFDVAASLDPEYVLS